MSHQSTVFDTKVDHRRSDWKGYKNSNIANKKVIQDITDSKSLICMLLNSLQLSNVDLMPPPGLWTHWPCKYIHPNDARCQKQLIYPKHVLVSFSLLFLVQPLLTFIYIDTHSSNPLYHRVFICVQYAYIMFVHVTSFSQGFVVLPSDFICTSFKKSLIPKW